MTSYGSEKPASYRPRVLDERLQKLLHIFGAVEIRGTKWCGKSWTALAFGESVVHLDDPNIKVLADADPSLALQGTKPHVIDEWQEVPATWDATRRAVDAAGGEKGAFILTGSSTPAKDSITHSGAGRIARLDMSTMTLWEQGISTGSVSLADLFAGSFEPSIYTGSLSTLADAICRGGCGPLLLARPPKWPQRSSTNISMPCTKSASPKGRQLFHSSACRFLACAQCCHFRDAWHYRGRCVARRQGRSTGNINCVFLS